MAAAIILTVGTLKAALSDRAALRRAGINSLNEYIAFVDARSESLRLTKSLLCFIGVLASLPSVMAFLYSHGIDPIGFRNGLYVLVGWLLGLNSGLDLYSRHFSPRGPRLKLWR
jgi:hypothetical protein